MTHCKQPLHDLQFAMARVKTLHVLAIGFTVLIERVVRAWTGRGLLAGPRHAVAR